MKYLCGFRQLFAAQSFVMIGSCNPFQLFMCKYNFSMFVTMMNNGFNVGQNQNMTDDNTQMNNVRFES